MLFIAVFGAGCALVLGLEDKPVVSPEEEGGLPDAADAAPPDLCAHKTPPPPPATDDDETTKATFVVAVRSFDFAEANDAGTIGFDLDGTCTCADPVGARHGAGPSCTSRTKVCDQKGGVDNAAAALSFITSSTSDGKGNDKSVKCGRTALLLVIGGYNGRANDTNVAVGPVLSPGLKTQHELGEQPSSCNPDGGTQPIVYAPRWDGTDEWSSDTTFVLPTTALPKGLLKGYVRDWVLVAQADQATNQLVTVALGPIPVEASQAIFVGQLEPLDPAGKPLPRNDPGTRATSVRISQGVIAMRTSATTILRGAGGVPTDTFGGKLCPGNPFYATFKDTLCQQLDVMAKPSQDFSGASCDAISAGIGFVAEPAHMKPPDEPLDSGIAGCGATPSCD